MKPGSLQLAGTVLQLDRPLLVGVLNTTPDSFSDGGFWLDCDSALVHALDMVAAGADIVDIGGESTRPGAEPVCTDEELDRVIPLLLRLRAESDVPVSIDTSKPEVMREAVRAGASMINDVNALRSEGALEIAAEFRVPVCLMHMGGDPRTMQLAPEYGDVVDEVTQFLLGRVAACQAAGIDRSAIILDPGFGFGKNLQHNIELFQAIPRLCKLGLPLLVGLSRKSMLGQITGKPANQRMAASVAAAVLAVGLGATLVRVHDICETADALKVFAALSSR
ncbi:MAG: dihydropteroate synthase [Lysobacterales bacterium]